MSLSSASTIVEYEQALWPQVDAFWTEILGRDWNATAQRRWHWLNANRTHYLALVDGQIAGNATLLRQEFASASGSPLDVGWITDFYVRPQIKGHGLGKQLTLRLMNAAPNLASFGQSEDARRCFARLGWTEPRWIPMLARTLPPLVSMRSPMIGVEESSFDDPGIDVVWARRRAGRAAGLRTARVFSKRLIGRPDATYRIFLARGADGPLGWIVTRLIREIWNRRFGPVPTGLIVDAMAIDDRVEVLLPLIHFAMRDLARRGAPLILAVQTTGNVELALLRSGFSSAVKLFGFELRRLPEKGFVVSPGASRTFEGLPALSFFDCDAELTF